MIANIYWTISNVIQIMLNTLHETSLNYNNPFYRPGKWNSKKLSILFEEKHYIQITFKVAFPRYLSITKWNLYVKKPGRNHMIKVNKTYQFPSNKTSQHHEPLI